MRAILLTGVNQLEVREVPDPAPVEGEVVEVKVADTESAEVDSVEEATGVGVKAVALAVALAA